MTGQIKILWVCNVMLPQIARELHKTDSPVGGWLGGLAEDMLHCPQVSLSVCFPAYGSSVLLKGQAGGMFWYGFSADLRKLDEYSLVQEHQFGQIIEEVKPDLLHVFGTEFPHALAAVNAFARPERTMVHIQGIVSVYALHFMADLPFRVRRQYTFRDLLKRANLEKQQRGLIKRGILEKQAIQKCGHIMGRTEWDRACTVQINPGAVYHINNETLRDAFYQEENRWNFEKCEPYTIFLSQGSYPVKGLHYVLEAMPLIRKRFPRVSLRVAGEDISRDQKLKDKIRQSTYGRYICQLLDRWDLRRSVTFTGFLDEEQMCRSYRQSHLFVCPSSIENSPNSMGEAMALGMPVIAADTGGVKSMLSHEQEGLIYPVNAPYMLACNVCRVFEDRELAERLGNQARKRAMKTHDRKQNVRQALEVYQNIMADAGSGEGTGEDEESG